MSTPAKREGNKRYLQKYSTRSVRLPLDQVPIIDSILQARHQSFNAYVLALIAEDLRREAITRPQLLPVLDNQDQQDQEDGCRNTEGNTDSVTDSGKKTV